MDSITDVKSVILLNKQKRDSEKAIVEQPTIVVDPQPTQIQPPTLTTPAPAPTEPTQAVPKSEPVKPTAEADTKKPDETPNTSVEETEFKWDADIPDPTQEQPTQTVDFKKLGSAFNLGEVTTETELVAKVNERFTKLKELEAQSLEGLPEQVKQIVDLARKGGDWSAFTGAAALDASKLDPVEIFERQYERDNAIRFRNPDGTIDYQQLDQEVAGIAPGIKIMQGNNIKQALVQRQQQHQAQIIADAVSRQETFQKTISEAARELPAILPKENFGISIEPKHSSFLYQGIIDGSLIKKHFGNIDPASVYKMDGKKLMKSIALAEFGQNISEFRYKQGETSGKKALLQSTQNIQLSAPSVLPRPEEPVVEQKTSAQLTKEAMERAKPKNSL